MKRKNSSGPWLNKHKAAALIDVSPHTLKSYRKLHWLPGVHFCILNSRTIRYHEDLIEDWAKNRYSNPEAHQRAIEAHLAKLSSNQPKKHRRGGS